MDGLAFASPPSRAEAGVPPPSDGFDLGASVANAFHTPKKIKVLASLERSSPLIATPQTLLGEKEINKVVDTGREVRRVARGRCGTRLGALYPALYPRVPGDEDRPPPASNPAADEQPQLRTVAVGASVLGFAQQRAEAPRAASSFSTPARASDGFTAEGFVGLLYAPNHSHVVATRRDPDAPRPTFDLEEDDDASTISSEDDLPPGSFKCRRPVVSRRLQSVSANVIAK